MIVAGFAFIPAALFHNEFSGFDITQVPAKAWMAIVYLVFFGSIAAFTAYVWLLQVRTATQVSTHAYVNPVIAVLLGVFFAQEHISWIQIIGLVIILLSVLLINLAKYRTGHRAEAGKAIATSLVAGKSAAIVKCCRTIKASLNACSYKILSVVK